jgi:hypothetical protein
LTERTKPYTALPATGKSKERRLATRITAFISDPNATNSTGYYRVRLQ